MIACFLMLLDWARERFGNGIPALSYENLRTILKRDARADGVRLNAPRLLTSSKPIRKSVPRLRFPYSFSTGLAEIETEIRKGYPVIAWLHQVIDGRPRNHSVVIVGLSDDKMSIKYLDPLGDANPVGVSTPEFLEQWSGTLNAQIRIHIEEDPLKYLPDYYEDKGEVGDR